MVLWSQSISLLFLFVRYLYVLFYLLLWIVSYYWRTKLKSILVVGKLDCEERLSVHGSVKSYNCKLKKCVHILVLLRIIFKKQVVLIWKNCVKDVLSLTMFYMYIPPPLDGGGNYFRMKPSFWRKFDIILIFVSPPLLWLAQCYKIHKWCHILISWKCQLGTGDKKINTKLTSQLKM